MWIAAAAVIATVIGATWVGGQNMATRDDLTQLRNEAAQHRNEAAQQRNEAAQQRNEIKAEIRAGRESADAQMEELRGYIVQHLDQHGGDRE